MNKNTNNTNIPEEILELTPWYAAGLLSNEEETLFGNALMTFPSLKAHLLQEQQMAKLVSADHSLLDKSAIAPVDERLKAVFNLIDVEEAQVTTNADQSFFSKVKRSAGSFLQNLGTPQYSKAMSLCVLTVSVAVLTAYVAPIFTDSSEFTPASAVISDDDEQLKGNNPSKLVLLIGFNGSSVELSNNAVLKDKFIKIDAVPNKKGVYQVSFKQSLGKNEVQKTIDDLLIQKELIWFAGESFESK